MDKMIDLGEQYGADRVWLNKIEDWGTIEDFSTQNIWNTPEYQEQLANLIARMAKRNDSFIECPTLISPAVLDKNKN